jgi:hypothetical protein
VIGALRAIGAAGLDGDEVVRAIGQTAQGHLRGVDIDPLVVETARVTVVDPVAGELRVTYGIPLE